jgi:PAS domain S-box-containing protein
VSGDGHFDLVLRELDDVTAILGELGDNGGGRSLREARERLLDCAVALRDARSVARTERASFESALARERLRYRELFDFAPAAYLITDAAASIEEANRSAGELLGVEPRLLVHKPLTVFVKAGERKAFRRFLLELRDGATPAEAEFAFTGRAREFVAGISVGHVHREEGPVSLRWLIHDVTERRRADDDVRRFATELEERVRERTGELERERWMLESVIEQMPAGVAITDAATGRLMIANPEAWEIARTRFEAEEGLEPLVGALRDVVARGMEVLETVGREGDVGAIEVHAAPLHDRDGAVVARVAVFRDVTARERVERAEREFVTNAAHELQTPLTAITSAAEVLQAGAKEIPDDRDRFLTHIQRECDRLARLVRALLLLSRAQSHGRAADAERLTLRPLLEDVAAALRPADAVRVEVSCPPRLTALANRDLTEQALVSIGANAAKFTARGTIGISARRLDRDRVAIEVIDTGPGIAESERGAVRQRFYRGGRRDRTGFGLGLAIAEQAAQALGGALELEAAPGGGTTARLVLPAGTTR